MRVCAQNGNPEQYKYCAKGSLVPSQPTSHPAIGHITNLTTPLMKVHFVLFHDMEERRGIKLKLTSLTLKI
ncbi:hypothetical protein BGAL_0207g00090 [Botrytis galanthina]|uniref:Uncharacterized protein n=1 Tax=Botrytis galanthina TaxID=278940 RepID=A0A4S8QVC6_9HELO|nr:hypothetical protein BGAL_0207g00090 [Botrytis galanthina]